MPRHIHFTVTLICILIVSKCTGNPVVDNSLGNNLPNVQNRFLEGGTIDETEVGHERSAARENTHPQIHGRRLGPSHLPNPSINETTHTTGERIPSSNASNEVTYLTGNGNRTNLRLEQGETHHENVLQIPVQPNNNPTPSTKTIRHPPLLPSFINDNDTSVQEQILVDERNSINVSETQQKDIHLPLIEPHQVVEQTREPNGERLGEINGENILNRTSTTQGSEYIIPNRKLPTFDPDSGSLHEGSIDGHEERQPLISSTVESFPKEEIIHENNRNHSATTRVNNEGTVRVATILIPHENLEPGRTESFITLPRQVQRSSTTIPDNEIPDNKDRKGVTKEEPIPEVTINIPKEPVITEREQGTPSTTLSQIPNHPTRSTRAIEREEVSRTLNNPTRDTRAIEREEVSRTRINPTRSTRAIEREEVSRTPNNPTRGTRAIEREEVSRTRINPTRGTHAIQREEVSRTRINPTRGTHAIEREEVTRTPNNPTRGTRAIEREEVQRKTSEPLEEVSEVPINIPHEPNIPEYTEILLTKSSTSAQARTENTNSTFSNGYKVTANEVNTISSSVISIEERKRSSSTYGTEHLPNSTPEHEIIYVNTPTHKTSLFHSSDTQKHSEVTLRNEVSSTLGINEPTRRRTSERVQKHDNMATSNSLQLPSTTIYMVRERTSRLPTSIKPSEISTFWREKETLPPNTASLPQQELNVTEDTSSFIGSTSTSKSSLSSRHHNLTLSILQILSTKIHERTIPVSSGEVTTHVFRLDGTKTETNSVQFSITSKVQTSASDQMSTGTDQLTFKKESTSQTHRADGSTKPSRFITNILSSTKRRDTTWNQSIFVNATTKSIEKSNTSTITRFNITTIRTPPGEMPRTTRGHVIAEPVVTKKPSTTQKPTEKPPYQINTTHYPPHISTTKRTPSVYIKILLRMSWEEFCVELSKFVEELMEIIREKVIQKVEEEQIRFIKGCSEIINEELSKSKNDPTILTIEIYITDEKGQIDIELTSNFSRFIKPGFEKISESKFSQKLVTVDLITPPTTEGNPNVVVRHSKKSTLGSGMTVAIIIASVGGFCCICLLVLQVVIHKRQKKGMSSFLSTPSRFSMRSIDSIALGAVAKSRPNSGFWNPGLEDDTETKKEPSNPLGYNSLSNMTRNIQGIYNEFEKLPYEMPNLSVVPSGAEDKNRFANVIPLTRTRVKLRKIPYEENSDYINANYITGYKGDSHAYIATQAPLSSTTGDFWRMVWEQQSRVIIMLTAMDENGQPRCTPYVPDIEGINGRVKYGDFTLVLKKKDVQQEYILSVLELKDIENNLIREIRHFWFTCWSADSTPEPISIVKLILDTRVHYEDSGAPVVVHCSSGTGRTGTLIAIDICMRSYESKRMVDIFGCVNSMRKERAGSVQNKEQYALIYKALHEYAVIMSSPSVSMESSAIHLQQML